MKLYKNPGEEKWYMMDTNNTEHPINFHLYHVNYPFDEMEIHDFFRIPDERRAQATRAAIQRYYDKEPVTCFLVRKHKDEWICRRFV